MENKQVFVVSKDSGITKVEDLKGKKVEVQVDSSGEKALADNKELADTFASLVTTADYNTAFQDLEMVQPMRGYGYNRCRLSIKEKRRR